MAKAAQERRTDTPFTESWQQLFAERGWSQRQVAREIGLDFSFLSKALRGADYKRLSADAIAAIAESAGLPPDYFPEVREAFVTGAVRTDPALRDRLYDELS